jgi:hypothetical protein
MAIPARALAPRIRPAGRLSPARWWLIGVCEMIVTPADGAIFQFEHRVDRELGRIMLVPAYAATIHKPGLGISRRDHPGAHLALRHAAAEPALYRRHARQEAGRPGRTEEGGRHRGAQRVGAEAVVEAQRVAAAKTGRAVATQRSAASRANAPTAMTRTAVRLMKRFRSSALSLEGFAAYPVGAYPTAERLRCRSAPLTHGNAFQDVINQLPQIDLRSRRYAICGR